MPNGADPAPYDTPRPPKLPIDQLLGSARFTMLLIGLFLMGSSLFFAFGMPRLQPGLEETTAGDVIRFGRLGVGAMVAALGLLLPLGPGLFAGIALAFDVVLEIGIYVAFPQTFHWGEGLVPQVLIALGLASAWNQARTYERLKREQES